MAFWRWGLVAVALGVLSWGVPRSGADFRAELEPLPPASTARYRFLVLAGGGAPSYNEIALEKNVRYFQRTLSALGFDPAAADVFFANGDGEATVRYLDPLGIERFKPPEIPHLQGPATADNLRTWLAEPADCGTFFYFTGHGARNRENLDNNALILWEEEFVSVRQLGAQLDQLPPDRPFVTMMAQCYAGAFANLIYEGGDPANPVALQTRCGFFATVASRPSVGCTPLVNEADYRDYSSSFFAGLSGTDRVGNPVDSADYDGDGRVSFAEAHSFSKVDAATPDWPVSTSEVWLQRRAGESTVQRILSEPMQTWLALAKPEQRYVIESLSERLGYDREQSFAQGEAAVSQSRQDAEADAVQLAYRVRLQQELVNVAMAAAVRESGDEGAIATLEKLQSCEDSSW